MITKEQLETLAKAAEIEFPGAEFLEVTEYGDDWEVRAQKRGTDHRGAVFCRKTREVGDLAGGKVAEIRGLFSILQHHEAGS